MSAVHDTTQSGFGKHLGMTIDELSGDLIRATVTVSPDHHQGYGIVHGGVYCAVAEHLASVAAATWYMGRGGVGVVGVSNTTHFIRAVRDGVLQVEVTPLQRGRTQQLWQIFFTDEKERLVAKGEVRLANISEPGLLG